MNRSVLEVRMPTDSMFDVGRWAFWQLTELLFRVFRALRGS
jgi:hypothetical protein